MNFVLTAIVPVLNSLFALILALYYYSAFSEGKNKRTLVTLCSFIVFSLSLLFVRIAFINFIITTVCTYLYTLRYRIKWYNRVLLTLSYVAMNVITEVLSALSLMTFFNVSIQQIKCGWLNAAGILLSKMLMLFIITVIIYSRHRLLLGKFRMYWTALYLLPLATAVVLVAQHYALFYFPDDHGLKILSAAGMILLIFSNLMIFAITDRMHSAIVTENRLVLAEELIKKQSEQYEQILNGSRDIIKIRHDHKNALMGLISDMEAEKYSDVKARLASDLTELEKPSFNAITGNIALDTVLGYKTAEAHSKGIEVVCRHNDVSDIPIPSVDISVLLGNALDNAIEAVQKLQDNRTVTVIIASRNGHIWITVTNSVAEDIDADNLTTQKAHSEYHGIGTVTMKAITEKYDGEIYFECRNRQFKTVIILPTQDE